MKRGQSEGKVTLRVKEAAELLGLSVHTVYDLTHTPDFPSFRLGRVTLIDRAGLEIWARAQVEAQKPGLYGAAGTGGQKGAAPAKAHRGGK